MAIRLADTARPNNHVDAEHLGTFPVAYAEDVWFADGTRLSEKTFDGQSVQKEELPLASADELGNIYQYIGETGTYTNGRFYKCILNSSVYSWSEIKMVENPVVYSETVPDINAYETGSIVCYTGEDSGSFEKGHLYKKHGLNLYKYQYVDDEISAYSFYFYLIHAIPEIGDLVLDENGEPLLRGNINTWYVSAIGDDYSNNNIRVLSNTDDSSVITFSVQDHTRFIRITDSSSTITLSDWADIGGGSKLDNVFLVKDSEGATTLAINQRIFTGTQAEWDALTVDEKAQYIIVNIVDDDGGTNLDYYSTEETKTNKVWIDGKPIYRKVLSGLNYSGSSDPSSPEWKAIGTLSDISQILNCVGLRPSNRGSVGTINSRMNGNNLELWSDIGLNPIVTHLLIEYTKEG